MQFQGFRIQPRSFEEGLDGLVRLFVEQEIQAAEIGSRQGAGLPHQMLDINPRGDPAHDEKGRERQQPPEIDFHREYFSFRVDQGLPVDAVPPLLPRRAAISRRWATKVADKAVKPTTTPTMKATSNAKDNGAARV